MAKKFKFSVGKLVVCLAAALGVAAFFMMFAPAVKGSGKIIGTEPNFSGFQVVFGYSENDTAILSFNFLAFLGLFVLPIAGVVCACFAFFSGKQTFAYVSAVLFIVGAVLAFLTVATFKSGVVMGSYYDLYNWGLGVGAILSGVFGALAGCILVVKELLKIK